MVADDFDDDDGSTQEDDDIIDEVGSVCAFVANPVAESDVVVAVLK